MSIDDKRKHKSQLEEDFVFAIAFLFGLMFAHLNFWIIIKFYACMD